MLEVKIFTLYPDLFPGPLNVGIYKKAQENKIWNLKVINIRDYATDKHGSVDDAPFGGGSGMLLRPDVVASALDANTTRENETIIYLSPKGKKFDQKIAKKLSEQKKIKFYMWSFRRYRPKTFRNQKYQRDIVLEILYYLVVKPLHLFL